MLGFQKEGAVVFDNGNLIRTQAKNGGVLDAFDIPIFTEAFLRPLFCRAIGPYRWIALSNDPEDIRKIDDYVLERFCRQQDCHQLGEIGEEECSFPKGFPLALPGLDIRNAPIWLWL